MAVNDTLLYPQISECTSQPSSEKLGDPELDNAQKVRDSGEVSPKGNAFIRPLLSQLRGLCRREGEKDARARGGG